jgi:AraC-like DNA-binding protein
MMPEMDGLEFCNRLKNDRTTCHIPVLLLTARTLESQEIEGYEHGADAYIAKPFTSRLLLARIENLLNGRKMLRNVFAEASSSDRQEEQQQLNSHDQVFIQTLRQAIQANLSNPQLKIEDLGEKVGLGRVQLYRKVKALTGSTPVELLRLARLERGRQLLKTTDMTISQVAYEVGFATPSYFTTCFRQQYGMYPNDVRI